MMMPSLLLMRPTAQSQWNDEDDEDESGLRELVSSPVESCVGALCCAMVWVRCAETMKLHCTYYCIDYRRVLHWNRHASVYQLSAFLGPLACMDQSGSGQTCTSVDRQADRSGGGQQVNIVIHPSLFTISNKGHSCCCWQRRRRGW